MNLNFLILGEYSYFVWPAFIFFLFTFLALFMKTYKELKKQEKLYLITFAHESRVYNREIQTASIYEKDGTSLTIKSEETLSQSPIF
jgi:heme exporter protein D